MAKETLVREHFTDDMITDGAELLQRLKNKHVELIAAFWLYVPEAEEWRLTLVSPQVDSEGPRRLYNTIREALREAADGKALGLDLLNITVLSPNDTMVRALANANDLIALSGKRLSGNRLNGIYVEDIYIYFIDESVKPLPGPKWISK